MHWVLRKNWGESLVPRRQTVLPTSAPPRGPGTVQAQPPPRRPDLPGTGHPASPRLRLHCQGGKGPGTHVARPTRSRAHVALCEGPGEGEGTAATQS